MKELQFVVEINASKEKVWNTLWQDDTFQDWASVIDPGTYMLGELKVGNQVEFISSYGGYGVTSLVEEYVKNERLVLRHQADTQHEGTTLREKEWTGGLERYVASESDGVTELTVSIDAPSNQETYFVVTYPKALTRVKELAEKK